MHISLHSILLFIVSEEIIWLPSKPVLPDLFNSWWQPLFSFTAWITTWPTANTGSGNTNGNQGDAYYWFFADYYLVVKNIKIACAPYGEGHGPIGSNIYCFFIETVCRRSISRDLLLGAVHKLRLQEEGGRWSKNWLFVSFHTIENVNGGGW